MRLDYVFKHRHLPKLNCEHHIRTIGKARVIDLVQNNLHFLPLRSSATHSQF